MGNKKRIFFIVSLLSIMAVSFFVYITVIKEREPQAVITFKEAKGSVEYYAKVEARSLIASSKGEIKSYPNIDTKKIGEQTIVFIVQMKGKEVKIPYTVEIKDTHEATIALHNTNIQLGLNEEFDPAIVVKEVSDPVDGKLYYSKHETKGRYTIESNVDTQKEGMYHVKIHAMDKNGNKSIATSNVVVKADKRGNDSVQPTYINGVLLVNKKYGLPRTFGKGIDKTAQEALTMLLNEAKTLGYTIPIISGFRSYDDQRALFAKYSSSDGIEKANMYSARAGHSEHQTGLSFDVGKIDMQYGFTVEGVWLEKNCAKYGFIIRYMKGKEHSSGYQYEPWHIRYVGKEIANKIMEEKISLEEYLGIDTA